MKILQINGGVFGSTGKIMFGITDAAEKRGHTVICASSITVTNRFRQPNNEYIKIGSYYGRCLSVLMARITGLEGCFSVFSTHALLRKIKKIRPNILHLHNIHNSYLNLPLLFRFIKKQRIPVVWTLHDCWAFTGHCSHFDMIGCDQWQRGCQKCPQYRQYPKTYSDNAKIMFFKKKNWFTNIENLTIITPSQWLANMVRQSFLKDYPLQVINNGIDRSVFCPTESNFRSKYQLEDKKILLGVSFGWGIKKGLDVFIEFANRLDDRYQIVLVGTDEEVDKQLPKNILSIHCTQDQKELAALYSAADVFINPTREDTYPTVNMEALACGTPVATFSTGGSPEILDSSCGITVAKDDIDALLKAACLLAENSSAYKEACLERSKYFDIDQRFSDVIDLYEKRT